MISYGTPRTPSNTPTPDDEVPWYKRKYASKNTRTTAQQARVNTRVTSAKTRAAQRKNAQARQTFEQGMNQTRSRYPQDYRAYRIGEYRPATYPAMAAANKPYLRGRALQYSPYQPVRTWTTPLNEAGASVTYSTNPALWHDPTSRIPQNMYRTYPTSSYGEEYDRQLNFYRQVFGSGFTGPWMEGALPYVSSVPAQYAQPQQQAGLPAGYSGYGNLGSYGGYGGYGGGYRGYGGGGGGGGYTAKSATPWKDYAANWIQSVANWRI